MNEEQTGDVKDEKKAEPLPVDPEERLDWDFYQPPPPSKRRWTVQARIVWKGKAQPMPVPDPDDE